MPCCPEQPGSPGAWCNFRCGKPRAATGAGRVPLGPDRAGRRSPCSLYSRQDGKIYDAGCDMKPLPPDLVSVAGYRSFSTR